MTAMHDTRRKMIRTRSIALALFALAATGPALVAGPARAQQETTSIAATAPMARRINLGVGKSVILDLPRDAAEIFVADPKVANAIVRSSRKLYVIAMGNGQTSIFAMDKDGRQIAAIDITIGRDISELGRIIKTALPKSDIVPRTINDTIILTGNADSAGEAQMAVDIAKGFAAKSSSGGASAGEGSVINSIVIRGRDQVMLKVTIAEVQRNILKQLGVTNAIARGSWGSWTMQNPLPLNLQNLTSGKFTSGAYDAMTAAGSSAFGLSAQIQAYERNGVARILAEPTVTAISGESAKFMAGGELPVPSGESCVAGGVCTVGVSFKPYGVSLNFTPVVLSEGRILLRVATEVTEVDPTTVVTFNTSSVPSFRTRKNETSVELPSGGSIVTAGLIQTTSRSMINGLPGLMNLPILGTLFRSRDFQRLETELMIVVTPYIAKPVKPADIALPTDGFADPTDPQAVLLGRVNRLYSTTSNPQVIRNFNGRVGFITD
jgi:pilus assembly protein CpaC